VPRALLGSGEAIFLPDKRYQLLAYLAYVRDWIGRETAAFLFWPDIDTAGSRQNLRGLMQRVHTIEFRPEIATTRHQLRWDVPTDVEVFDDAVGRGSLDEAIAAYRGSLMDGLGSESDSEYGEWLEIEREHLRTRWRAVVIERLVSLNVGEEQIARKLIRRLLASDPLDEEAVRTYLLAATRLGRPDDAQTVYREFESRLQREMGLEPTSDTAAALELSQAFATRTSAGAVREPVGTLLRPVAFDSTRRQQSLPLLATTFVGREREISQIAS